ncbi:MAG: patatin-like phospholipase family protein [Deltaproteobacteria bacterium]|nr:patatin-like phospholipase family protein [Deltaproteobacteria bacterium]
MKIGLALGGGGVRGLAHILVLEALDELGIRPGVISGTSMGAIIGALYASGISGREIRERIVRHLILKDDTWRDIIAKKNDLLKLVTAFSAEFPRGGFINPQGFFEYLFSEIRKRTFEELEIPLLVIAADYWTAEEIVFEADDLLPALQASMAVPGVFVPVSLGNRVLVDGGVVNQVPYDHLLERADFTIAVDVSRSRNPGKQDIPRPLEAVLGAFNIMQASALAERMKHRKPDIYVQPEIQGIRMLDFGKIEDVFLQAAPAIDLLREQLKGLENRTEGTAR